MQESIPEPIDNSRALEQKQSGEATPLLTVLLQEIDRYNALLSKIHWSLSELRKGIKGLVVISSELEEMFACLYDSKVPPLWLKAYPSLKPLGAWSRDLVLRVQQLQQWVEHGQPKVFWLSGFTFPTGFLTAVLQTASRKTNTPIDQLAWDFTVSQVTDIREIRRPRRACVRGLYLRRALGPRAQPAVGAAADGAVRFDARDAVQADREQRKVTKGTYACPCYMYPVRTGTRERPSFMLTVDLKSQEAPDHWVKRGTALLLSLAQ